MQSSKVFHFPILDGKKALILVQLYQLKNGTESYLHYSEFSIESAESQYQLNISGFDSIGVDDPFYNYISN